MRIIAGTLKHRVIPSPPGSGTRPTSDRVRESIFSVLEHSATLKHARVLDLCSGSGALAFEALSRGAASAMLIDTSADVCRQLRETATALNVSPQIQIMKAKVPECISHLGAEQFDVIFVDPPYAQKVCNTILYNLLTSSIVAPGACLVFEHGDQEHILPVEGIEIVSSIETGTTVADIFCYRGPMT